MLLGTLEASLSDNILTGKGVKVKISSSLIMRDGEVTIREA